jgi:predicted nuclease of restriction endonuclease-like (RecB) superfamily
MNYSHLLSTVSQVHQAAQRTALGAVNKLHVLRNWTVGCLIVEFEQHGEDRAAYGEKMLKKLCADLDAGGMTGLGLSTLKGCRTFYRLYPQIGQPAVGQFNALLAGLEKGQPLVGLWPVANDTAPSSDRFPMPLPAAKVLELSWSHLLEFIRLDDPWKRAFYENECLKGNWSKRQLQRQIGSLLYDRTALSTDKETVINHARGQALDSPGQIADLIRDPYVLEFIGLAEQTCYLEKDLEKALLDHLQAFLLELGTGFCFEARQKRITVGDEHDYIDLVFYHRILRCHLLIDLKTRAFQHGDAGQIHPMRYYAGLLLLRLCSSQPQRQGLLHRFYQRFATAHRRASRRSGAIHEKPFASRTRLLRSMPFASRCHKARKVSEKRVGKTLPQGAHRRLSHGVNFYLNYWKDQMMAEGDQPPVGLILCTDKKETRVNYATAGLDQQLFVSRYLVALPKPEELQALIENACALWQQQHPQS